MAPIKQGLALLLRQSLGLTEGRPSILPYPLPNIRKQKWQGLGKRKPDLENSQLFYS